jgi:hypothetical protein
MLLQRFAVLDARAVRQLRCRQRAQIEPGACLASLIENLLRFGVEVAVPARECWVSQVQGERAARQPEAG